MKNTIIGFVAAVCVLFSLPAISQDEREDTTLTLDLLRAPQSPAFNILGISPTEIDRPSDPTDFIASVANATDNFSSFLPKNYALEFTPSWLFGKRNLDNSSFISAREAPWQNMVISLATATSAFEDTVESTKLGLGLKMNLFRGRISDEFADMIDSLQALVHQYHLGFVDIIDNDESIQRLEHERDSIWSLTSLTTNQRRAKRDSLNEIIREQKDNLEQNYDNENKELIEEIKERASEIQLRRFGWKLDWATAVMLDFPSQNADSVVTRRWAFWLTGGYEAACGISGLALGRILVYPNQQLTDSSGILKSKTTGYLDLGGRLIIDRLSRFTVTGEFIGRIPLNNTEETKATIKYTVNFSYEVAKNKLLTMTIGKDFEGQNKFGGNLIAALNLALGFGSSRPVIRNQ